MSKWDVDLALASLTDEVDELEGFRHAVLRARAEGSRIMGFLIAGALILGGLVAIAADNGVLFLVALPIGLIGGAIVHHSYFAKGAARYREAFKRDFLAGLITKIEPEVSYSPDSGIAEGLFVGSGLFGSRPDRYQSEDLIHGKIGATSVQLSEVHAEEKDTRTDSKGQRKTHWTTLFRGIFFIADFHKDFRSPVSVMPDVAERHFGWLGKKLQKLGGNLQRMENPKFEKMFVVRGEDAVEARYILTPSMQDRLVDLRGRLGKDLRVGFRQSHVWIAIPNASNWFEADLQMPAGDRTQTKMLLG
jgi:hypothetical protein